MKTVAIVGAGFSGAVIARQLAETGRYQIELSEQRGHVAGNCHTARDDQTGVMVHEYGPHIFHTSNQRVWDYINTFGAMRPFTNRVKAVTAKGVFSLPVNLHTINQFFGKNLSPRQAKAFIEAAADMSIKSPRSFEEQALRFVGRDLYEAFFRGYTKKQWGVDPRELPASILKRLPVRFNYDDNYYNDIYQGIPEQGYTAIIDRILDHPAIQIELNCTFKRSDAIRYDHVFYSGPIDGFFDCDLGPLRYRTLDFERFQEDGDFQGNAVLNYCEEQVPYTRITEHKHFAPWETHRGTVCFREFSKATAPGDIPYYPLRLQQDLELLGRYQEYSSKVPGVTFVGRLGTYRYLDMHMVIEEALDTAAQFLGRA